MKNMQKAGGTGAFVLAFAYIIGMGMAFTVLDMSSITDPLEKVRFLVGHYRAFYLWIALIYITAGVFLIPLGLAVKERIEQFGDPNPLNTLAALFCFAWAVLIMGSGLLHNAGLLETVSIYEESPEKAWEFWRLIETVHRGIGAEAEIPGGLWSLLVGIAALKTGAFPRWLNILAMVAGSAGLLTIFPPLADYVIALYAFGQIIWWIGMGTLMFRSPAPVLSDRTSR
ncbi:MAG: DUF4386 family protein [Spirochaetales bacterium]|nr:DUF4386 family protein [Spirochaetales bacterium]